MTQKLVLAAVAAVTLVGASSAFAGCADPRSMMSARMQVPMPAALASRADAFTRPESAAQNIVGTWLVTYMAGGNPAGQAYIQWHSDGTEWENINFPIEGGNICMGSWKSVDSRHVSRNHYGWLYTAGLLTGYFNETETAEVGRHGTYTGVTDMKIYDNNGNLLTEFSGTSSAVQIAD